MAAHQISNRLNVDPVSAISSAGIDVDLTAPNDLTAPWRSCSLCKRNEIFRSYREFCRHLRDFHCTKEGGSYVCRYGKNGVCPSLPLEGVSDKDYEDHILKCHVKINIGKNGKPTRQNSEESPPPNPINSEPSVVQDQHKWTIYNSRVNLPAVLNNPTLLKRETDFFTKTWGNDFVESDVMDSTFIPPIRKTAFESYLHRTVVRYRKHLRLTDTLKRPTPDGDLSASLQRAKQLEKNREELEQIPKLYMTPNFSLENPDTFNVVFPWTQVESSKTVQTGAKQSSKLLQEKLSHYLDVVEGQIAKQISMKSGAFFHAMTSHDELQEYLKKTLQAVKYLRDKIHTLDEILVKGSLKIMKLSKTRANYVLFHNKLKLMATVHQAQPTIQLLLSTNEFVGALDLIATSQDVLTQELAGIHSFRHLGSQLAELEKLIDKMLQAEYIKYVSSELNRPVTDLNTLLDEEKLVSMLFGMLRKQKFNFIDIYRDEAFTALKATIKQSVVEAVCEADDIDTDGTVGSLADQMRLLDYSQWMFLLRQIFKNLLAILKRTKAFHGVVSDVVGIAAGRTKIPTPLSSPVENVDRVLEEPQHLHVSVCEDVDVMISVDDYNKLNNSMKEMLFSVCDNAHDRCVKVIVARAKDGFMEKLSAAEFVQLSKEVEKFASECEQTCGRKSTSLRGSLQSQASIFVNHFHEDRKQKLSLILDNERWKQADVPTEFQELFDHILKTGTFSFPEKRIDTERKPADCIIVDGQKFAVVGTVLMVFKIVVEYCHCVDNIPSAAADLLTRLIELLKTFNSRTCQLVLGAGALQLVGLKTISTRTLGLASRCLQLIVHYIPKIKEHFEERLPSKKQHILKHLEQIGKDYNDHINEITNKLVTISENMIDQQLSKWEIKAPMPSSCFRFICKQIGKLHEALIDVLPLQQVKDLFKKIHASFKNRLKKQLISLNVTNDGGPQHGLVTNDLLFYSGNYRTLKGIEELQEDMSDVWNR